MCRPDVSFEVRLALLLLGVGAAAAAMLAGVVATGAAVLRWWAYDQAGDA